mgnify:CR=1 FL=1
MKKSEVPQDQSSLKDKNYKELYYAVDEDGKFTTELSTGWEPKTIVQEYNLNHLKEIIEEAKNKVKNGESSPIEYFMELNRMDWAVLADYMNKWVWQIKRHRNPNVFKNLSNKTLNKYAETFGISVQELKSFTGN